MGDLKFQLQHYAAELWRRKWSILFVSWLVGMLGCYMAATRPDVYTSRAAVEIDENLLLSAVLPKGAPRTDIRAAIDSVRRGIYARPNLEKIIRNTDEHIKLIDQRGWEKAVADLEEKLELKRQGPSFYVIEYTHNDPKVARKITQAALDLFLEKAIAGSSGAEGSEKEQARRFLEEQLATATTKLADTEDKIATLERENPEAIGGTGPLASEKRSLESQQAQLQSDLLFNKQELTNLQARLSSTPPQVIVRYEPQANVSTALPPARPKLPVPTGPSIARQKADAFEQQVSQLQLEVQTILERLTPQHPDVATMQRRLSQAEADLARLRGEADAADAQLQQRIQQAIAHNAQVDAEYQQYLAERNVRLPDRPVYGPNPALTDLRAQIASYRSRIAVTEKQLGDARRNLDSLQAKMAGQPEILLTYNKLLTAQDKYSNEVERLEQDLVRIGAGSSPAMNGLVDFEVVEAPQVPVTPAGPNRLLLFMGAFMLAAGSGTGLAFLRVQLADNIPTLTHLKQSFDLPILGGVSLIESKADTARQAAGNLIFLASVAAMVTIFGYVTYRYHVELWRPDFAGIANKASGVIGTRS